MDRQAQLSEVIIVAVLVVSVLMVSVFGSYFINEFRLRLNESNPNITEADNLFDTGRTNFHNTVDGMSLVLAGLLIIGAGLLAFLLPTHLLFIVVAIIGLFFLVPASGILKDVYFAFTNQTVLNATAVFFTSSNTVMTNFPLIMLIADLVFIITMFVKGAMMS